MKNNELKSLEMTIDDKTLKIELKASEILKVCRERGQKRAGGISLDEAIAELEELIKPKSCEGCKYQTIAEADCKTCSRYYRDEYELKEQ